MSAELIANLRASVANADDDMADAIADAQHTGERPDLDDWHVEVPVEWLREAADRIEALEAALASARAEAVEECLAHIDYVRANIVPDWRDRRRFDQRHINQAFKSGLLIARERITGEDADKWTIPAPPASAKGDG